MQPLSMENDANRGGVWVRPLTHHRMVVPVAVRGVRRRGGNDTGVVNTCTHKFTHKANLLA